MTIFFESLVSNIVMLGYGSILYKLLFGKGTEFKAELFFFGVLILSFLCLILNIFLPLNIYVTSVVCIFGLIFFYVSKNYKDNKFLRQIFISSLLATILLAFGKTYDDFGLYHLPTIQKITESNISLGEANIHFRFGHNFILFYLVALFKSSFANYNFIFVPQALIYSWFIIYLVNNLYYRKDNFIRSLSLFVLSIFLIKFYNYGDHGLDVPVVIFFFIIIFYFSEYFIYSTSINKNRNETFIKILFFSIFLITLKISLILIFFLPLYLFFFYEKKFFLKNLKIFIFLFSLVSMWLFSNILISSCLIYPVNLTCLNLSWSPPQTNWNSSVSDVYMEVSGWSKGWIDSLPNRGKNFDWGYDSFKVSIDTFLKSNWYVVWFNGHFVKKVFPFILSIMLIYLCLITILKKNLDQNLQKYKKIIFLLYIFSFLNLLFWFNTAPLLRFGFSQIILITFLIVFSVIQLNLNNNKNIKIVIMIIFFIFVARNINLQKFENFHKSFFRPYPSYFSKSVIKNIPDYKTVKLAGNLNLNITNGNECFDISFPCTHFSDIKYNRLIVDRWFIFKIFKVL
jgi:hypothetical protein